MTEEDDLRVTRMISRAAPREAAAATTAGDRRPSAPGRPRSVFSAGQRLSGGRSRTFGECPTARARTAQERRRTRCDLRIRSTRWILRVGRRPRRQSGESGLGHKTAASPDEAAPEGHERPRERPQQPAPARPRNDHLRPRSALDRVIHMSARACAVTERRCAPGLWDIAAPRWVDLVHWRA